MSDLSDVTTLEPVTEQFIQALAAAGDPPIYALSPSAARDVLARAQAAPIGKPAARIEDISFPVGPTGSVPVRIVRPVDHSGPLPVIMHFHGGGWVLGDKNTHDRLVRELAVGVHAAVVFVEYGRSPELAFPVAIEQAYAAMEHVAHSGTQLGLDPTRLAVVGDSVGGNMAAAVTMLAKERRGPRIAFQVLFYPVTDADFETGSYRKFQDGPWLTRHAMKWFWDAYLPEVEARRQIMASPLNATVDQLKDLPDALVIVGENDVLRDEGEAYARKLAAAGVRVISTRYNGTIHDFVLLNALADTPAVRGAVAQAVTTLRCALA